jgi:hypothetical protein
MADNGITFTSNIKFVKYSTYEKLCRGCVKIGFSNNERDILNASKFYSKDIRTCTGGGLVAPKKEAEGFHFLDDINNKKNFMLNIARLFNHIKEPKNAVLIGSKDLAENKFSIEQFQKLKKVFKKKVKNVTSFEEHNYLYSETHYHYSLNTDTWTLCSRYWTRGNDGELVSHTVTSVDELRKCFKDISIAPSDRLFIGKKEILPENCPDLFQNFCREGA